MHPVSQSATTVREQRRQETTHRIHRCALRLTRDHGLDGWTLEDLADAADVSRRTLFNYFPGKVDAVLGRLPTLPDDAEVATFAAGGPTGRLMDDLGALAAGILQEKDFDRETVELRRHVITTTPRLVPVMRERVEALFAEAVELIVAREGAAFGARRARLAVRVLVSLVDAAIVSMTDDGDVRPITELFEETLRDARELFA